MPPYNVAICITATTSTQDMLARGLHRIIIASTPRAIIRSEAIAIATKTVRSFHHLFRTSRSGTSVSTTGDAPGETVTE